MIEQSQKAIIALKVLGDTMNDFSLIVENRLNVEKKYGINYDDMKTINFLDPSLLQELTNSLSNEKLGILLGIFVDITSISPRFHNFTNFDKKELGKFHEHLKSITKKLDIVLGA